MNVLRLTFANLKRYIKNTSLLIGLIVIPFTLVMFVNLFNSSDNTSMYSPNVSIVCNTKGKYETELIKKLKIDNKDIFSYDKKDEAMNLLENNDTSVVFVLNNNFSSDIDKSVKPSVKAYKTKDGGGSIWHESLIENFINDKLKEKIDPNINSKLVTANIVDKDKFEDIQSLITILLVCYWLYANSGVLCKDLLDLRSNNVLTRMISTKNKNIEIIFSIFFALFLLQSLSCLLVLIILKFILDISISFNMFIMVIANSFTATGFIVALTRIFKNEASVSIVSIIYSIFIMFLSIIPMFDNFSKNLSFLNNLAKLSPLYWTIESLSTSNITFNLIAILLIGLVFVTAGSFKLREFAKN
ncbi:ABC transporter permease [Paraclostridium tenue]